LDEYTIRAKENFSDHIEAIILTGSLATNSYIPGPGDIDQITILKENAPDESESNLRELINSIMEQHGNAINFSNIIYRRSELSRPWQQEYDLSPEERHRVCAPEELLRMADHGVVIFGDKNIIRQLDIPTVSEMREYHLRWRIWSDKIKAKDQKYLCQAQKPSARIAIQSILSKAPWHFYYHTGGETFFDKNNIAHKIDKCIPNYLFQQTLDVSTKIRVGGNFEVSDEAKNDLLERYYEFFNWVKVHDVDEVPYK
jgi:hypothetical protein